MTDILNLRRVAEKMNIKVSNVYHRLTFAMKGAVDQLDEEGLDELKRVLNDEHQKTIKFIDALKKKQALLQTTN